nr:hypothetical protein [Streptomyces sp. WAC04770]
MTEMIGLGEGVKQERVFDLRQFAAEFDVGAEGGGSSGDEYVSARDRREHAEQCGGPL